jgi:hypothetical protein
MAGRLSRCSSYKYKQRKYSFFVFPDGTNMFVDMGDFASEGSEPKSLSNPNDSLSSAEWVYNYIKEFHPKGEEAGKV